VGRLLLLLPLLLPAALCARPVCSATLGTVERASGERHCQDVASVCTKLAGVVDGSPV
jgi:hypothetical protein